MSFYVPRHVYFYESIFTYASDDTQQIPSLTQYITFSDCLDSTNSLPSVAPMNLLLLPLFWIIFVCQVVILLVGPSTAISCIYITHLLSSHSTTIICFSPTAIHQHSPDGYWEESWYIQTQRIS